MKLTLCTIAVLVLAASSLAAEDLLRRETPLDLQDLGRAGDWFGTSVALSGDGRTLVVGAAQAGTKGTRSGAVHVFRLRDEWQRDHTIRTTGEETTAFDAFGYSVAVNHDGTLIAVGAPLHDTGKGNAGAVYVWRAGDDTWRRITASVPALNDNFGTAVALSPDGSVLAVGAPQPNPVPEGQKEPSGKVLLFDRERKEIAQLTPAPEIAVPEQYAFFGFDVAVNANGTVVVVGAPGFGPNLGAAFVFERDGESWTDNSSPNARLQAEHPAVGDDFGFSVSVSRNGLIVVAGARAAGVSGRGYVFSADVNAGWKDQRVNPQLSASDPGDSGFGTSVSLDGSGRVVLVGAPGTQKAPKGAVYFFQAREGGRWSRVRLDTCTEGRTPVTLGHSVSLSALDPNMLDGSAVAGAPLDSDAAGSVCAFDLAGVEVEVDLVAAGGDLPGCVEKKDTKEIVVVPGCSIQYKVVVRNRSEKVEASDIPLVISFDSKSLSNMTMVCVSGPCPRSAPVNRSGSVSVVIPVLGTSSSTEFRVMARVLPEVDQQIRITATAISVSDTSALDLTFNQDSTSEGALNRQARPVVDNKVDEEYVAERGTVLHYTITITNAGPSQLRDLDVKSSFDEWDAVGAVTWTRGKRSGSGTLNDQVAFLLPGEKLIYRMEAVTRKGSHVRELQSTVRVAANPEGGMGVAKTILPLADLQLTKVSPSTPAVPGEEVTLTATVRNEGPDDINGAFVNGSIMGDDLVWSCGPIDVMAGAEASCEGKIILKPDFRTALDRLTGTAEVLATEEVPDPKEGNNQCITSSDDCVLGSAVLLSQSRVVGTLSPDRDPAIPGDEIVYSLTLKNAGPSDLLGATLQISDDAEDLTVTRWVCELLDPGAKCTGGSAGWVNLPVGKGVQFSVLARSNPAARKKLRASVDVTSDPHEQAIIAPLSTETDLSPRSVLRLVLVVQPTPAIPTDNLGFYLTIKNNGPSSLLEAEVSGSLPASLNASLWGCGIFGANAVCTTGGVDEKPLKGRIFNLSVQEEVVQYVAIAKVAADPGSTIQVRFDIAPGADDAILGGSSLCEVSIPLTVEGCHGG